MSQKISFVGAIISAIGGVMLTISGFPAIDGSELGKISAQAPLITLLIVLISILPMTLGVTVALVGFAMASKRDKKGIFGPLIMSIVALIGGFIPLTLYDYPTLFLCDSRLFNITFNGFRLNYDAIIMIIGTTINMIGIYSGNFKKKKYVAEIESITS